MDNTRKKYSRTIISSIAKSKFKTVLTDPSIEDRMKSSSSKNEDAFLFLSSIGQIMDEITEEAQREAEVEASASGVSSAGKGSSNDPTDDDDTTDTLIRDQVNEQSTAQLALEKSRELEASMDDDANRLTVSALDDPVVDESNVNDGVITTKLGYNRFMITSAWKVGKERLEKDNVRSKRLGAVARAQRKLLVKKVIMDAAKESGTTLCDKEELDIEMPPWTKHIMGLYPEDYNV